MAEIFAQDKRQDLRLKKELPVNFRTGEMNYTALTEDISLGGAFIKVEVEKKILGKRVIVEIISSPIGSPITTAGKVVWFKEEKDRILGVGIKFIDIDEGNREEILKLVLEKLFPAGEARISFGSINRKWSEKEIRSLEILDLIRREGPISISNISHAIGVNVVTTTHYLKDYLKKELIIDCGEDISSGGRRPNLMALNPQFGFVIGLEINYAEKFILAVITDLSSKVIVKEKEELTPEVNIFHASAELILRLIKNSKVDIKKILGIAFGLDNVSHGEPLKEYIEKKIGLPVLSQRSAQIGAFAEKWLNTDLAETDSLVYLDSLGHCSLVLGGQLYFGASEDAGRIYCQQDIQQKIFCLISLINPQVIVISKKLIEKQEDTFLKILREDMRRMLSGLSKLPAVITSTLGEETGALAVCSLAVREIFMQI